MDPKHSIGPDRIDYQETPGDLTEAHAAIEREHPEPTATGTPVPLWLTGLCFGAVAWAGMYLGLFHGGFRGDVFNERLSSPSLLFPTNVAKKGGKEEGGGVQTLAQQGKSVYSNCQPCHQANGKGTPGTFPPLAKSEWVNGSEKRLIAILLKGLTGPLNVEGTVYNGLMPAWEKQLTPLKIAAVASYIRSSFDNNAPEITEGKVVAAIEEFKDRTKEFTEAELLQIPADAVLQDKSGAAPSGAAPASAPKSGAAAPAAGAAGAPPVEEAKLMAQGKAQYGLICGACHQATGKGLPGAFPPLENSEYVTGAPDRLVGIVLKGVMGPITVNGVQFMSAMPPQGMALDDKKIAAVTTYVRKSFGNNAPAISPDFVAQVRKRLEGQTASYTEADLKAWKSE